MISKSASSKSWDDATSAKIESDLGLLKWMVGTNIAITLLVLAFVLRGHVA